MVVDICVGRYYIQHEKLVALLTTSKGVQTQQAEWAKGKNQKTIRPRDEAVTLKHRDLAVMHAAY